MNTQASSAGASDDGFRLHFWKGDYQVQGGVCRRTQLHTADAVLKATSSLAPQSDSQHPSPRSWCSHGGVGVGAASVGGLELQPWSGSQAEQGGRAGGRNVGGRPQSALPAPEHREEGTLLGLGGLGSEAGRAFLPWGAPATGPSGLLGGAERA